MHPIKLNPSSGVAAPSAGSESPLRGTDYSLHGFSFASSEERHAAAVGHPLWKAYIAWDRRRHCGFPDMDDAHDREVFEAYIEGAHQAAAVGGWATQNDGTERLAESGVQKHKEREAKP